MKFASAIGVAWSTGLVLQVLLVALVMRKRLWKTSPAFTAFVLFSLVETTVGLALYHHRTLYLYTYIVGESILISLGLALVYEIFVQLCAFHFGLRKLATISLRIVIILLLALAGVVIYVHSPIGPAGMQTALLTIEEAARLLELGLIMFLFLFSGAFGLHWRQQVFGTALGFGISTATELAAVTLASHVSPATALSLNLIHVLSFDLSLFIWIGYTLAPERVPAGELPKREQLEQWNQAVMELLGQ